MTEELDKSRSLDLLGIKPIAKSIDTVTTGTVNAAAAFLSRICLPAAEEFGLLLRDGVRGWRASNIASITQKAERKLKASNAASNVHAHPRLAFKILAEGSWIDDDLVQEMWAGLLSSSCSQSGVDDSNLIFVNLLSELTKVQARILCYICYNAKKKVSPNGLVTARDFTVQLDVLQSISQENDIYRLDRELDHLRGLALIHYGFSPDTTTDAELEPSSLALQLYVRTQGTRQSPVEFFGLEIPKTEETEPDETESNENTP